MTAYPTQQHERGYSLLETLVALVVFCFALLAAANALTSQAALAKHLEVRQDLVRSAETVLEGVRGGLLAFESGAVELDETFRSPTGNRVYVFVNVEDLEPTGLYSVQVRAWTYLPGRKVEVELRTMVWRP
jgi:prepilin-type N-terminal cleavage/methylation domain-containing protein